MFEKAKKLFAGSYIPLNRIDISKENLASNLKYLNSINSSIKITPVLKSNAYGHGLVLVAKALDDLNCPMFCVDSIYEAYELLKAKVKTPILIMGYINPENLKVKKLPFSYAVYDTNLLEAINTYQKGAQIHLKIDTGMHRLGIQLKDLPDFIKTARQMENIKITGIMSHLASGDDPNDSLTKQQLTDFKKSAEIAKSFNINPTWKHIAASDGLLNIDKARLAEVSNLARVGLAMYGISDSKRTGKLKPVLNLTSQIVQIKTLEKDDKVGYSGTFIARNKMLIGILPIGYNDGVDRRLSNRGTVTVKNKQCSIIGRVSMNITAIDLTSVPDTKAGDKVVVYSKNSDDPNSIANSAKTCETIPYELLVHLSPTSIRRQLEPIV